MRKISEKALTRLRDMVFGRPRIKILNAKELIDVTVRPIFIIGTFRSGTTLLRFILDSHSHIACPPESKFLEPLARLYDSTSCMRALDFMGYEKEFIRNKIKDLSDSFFIPYMLARKKNRWADKTPEYVRILEFIEWLYGPHCKYILIYRNGLDVAGSMVNMPIERLGSNKNIDDALEYWAHDMEIMMPWKVKYPNRCFSLKYENLCADPKPLLLKLFDFLGEEWEEGVLKWYQKGHDRGDEDIKARRQRGIQISFGNFKKWPEELQEKLKNKSADLHKKLGYDSKTLQPNT